MKIHIGQKAVRSKPMNRGDYNDLRGWETPKEENLEDKGYLVEYLDSPNSNHPDFKNYISWSPKGVFERSYRENGTLPFGMAILVLNSKRKIRRKCWPLGCYLRRVIWGCPSVDGAAGHVDFGENGQAITVGDNVGIINEFDDSPMVPWSPSQPDMFSEDWEVIPYKGIVENGQ